MWWCKYNPNYWEAQVGGCGLRLVSGKNTRLHLNNNKQKGTGVVAQVTG
jgi:hypothetical protein